MSKINRKKIEMFNMATYLLYIFISISDHFISIYVCIIGTLYHLFVQITRQID